MLPASNSMKQTEKEFFRKYYKILFFAPDLLNVKQN